MTTTLPSPLDAFAAWIQQSDPHAGHRLELLRRVRPLLAGEDEATAVERRALAEKVERWRYQLLREHAEQRTPQVEALAAALDLAANELAERPDRPPRAVRQAIHGQPSATIAEALVLLDPAVPLEDVTRRATEITRQQFGDADGAGAMSYWPMLLYAPIYLSNYCINHCTYCGFKHASPIARRHLSAEEVLDEAQILRRRGFRHILLVAGDFPSLTSTDYFTAILRMLVAEGFQPSVEIAPQSTEAYAALADAGACGVTLYQETYDETRYRGYHPRGTKAAYDWRLEGLDRAAEAGIPRLGLGTLLGLGDPQAELRALMQHAAYLQGRFPQCRLAFSLPRIHEAPAGFTIPELVDDALFLRMYSVLRIAFPQATLVLSTREVPALRDRLAKICITQLSAGSSTAPGGYHDDASPTAGEQFPVCDQRSVEAVTAWLTASGFRTTWTLE